MGLVGMSKYSKYMEQASMTHESGVEPWPLSRITPEKKHHTINLWRPPAQKSKLGFTCLSSFLPNLSCQLRPCYNDDRLSCFRLLQPSPAQPSPAPPARPRAPHAGFSFFFFCLCCCGERRRTTWSFSGAKCVRVRVAVLVYVDTVVYVRVFLGGGH